MTPELGLRLERGFAAPPEAVFDAWTSPEVLRRWWAAQPTWTSPGCDVDLRPGGRYLLAMQDDLTGEVHTVGGEFREVTRPHRLVYTWCWEGGEGPASLVTVEFHRAGAGTRLVLEHIQLPSAESVARHEDGWIEALENLRRRVFPGDD